MTRQLHELLQRGIHVLRRSSLWWGFSSVFFVVLNAAFWPSLKGSDALKSFEDMGSMLEAFGAQNIGSASGYLDGQLFAFMLPTLLSAMVIAQCSAITAGDEDAGRLELVHALPVSRSVVWLTNWAAAGVMLAAVTAAVVGASIVCLSVFSFDGVGAPRIAVATIACGLLAAFHGAIAYAAAGLGMTRGRAAGAGAVALMVGYIIGYLLPIADALQGARQWSPWYWAIGQQPVTDGVRPSLALVLIAVTAAVVVAGTVAVGKRDIRSA